MTVDRESPQNDDTNRGRKDAFIQKTRNGRKQIIAKIVLSPSYVSSNYADNHVRK